MTNLLVFDDDPIFGSILKRHAHSLDVNMTVCSNMDDFALKALEGGFDVAIVDYMLDDYRGPDVARVLEGQPALIISRFADLNGRNSVWPDCVKGFVCKDRGAQEIILQALAIK